MPLKIAILEDNAERCSAMRARLVDRFPPYELCFFTAARPMLDWLRLHLRETLAISLDHDLEPSGPPGASWIDPGTGREIADFLASQPPQCPVTIHSTNVAAALGMEMVLAEAGWRTSRITPYDDLAWIGREWFWAMRDAIMSCPGRTIASQRPLDFAVSPSLEDQPQPRH